MKQRELKCLIFYHMTPEDFFKLHTHSYKQVITTNALSALHNLHPHTHKHKHTPTHSPCLSALGFVVREAHKACSFSHSVCLFTFPLDTDTTLLKLTLSDTEKASRGWWTETSADLRRTWNTKIVSIINALEDCWKVPGWQVDCCKDPSVGCQNEKCVFQSIII